MGKMSDTVSVSLLPGDVTHQPASQWQVGIQAQPGSFAAPAPESGETFEVDFSVTSEELFSPLLADQEERGPWPAAPTPASRSVMPESGLYPILPP